MFHGVNRKAFVTNYRYPPMMPRVDDGGLVYTDTDVSETVVVPNGSRDCCISYVYLWVDFH